MSQRRGGMIEVKVGSVMQEAAGAFDFGLGNGVREALVGSARVAGYIEKPQPAYIDGEVFDTPDLDLKALMSVDGETVTLTLANGKVVILRDAWFAGDGKGETAEGKIKVRFESKTPAEVI